MPNTNFEWTDELVFECIDFYDTSLKYNVRNKKATWTSVVVDDFKKSKEVKKDYEILSFQGDTDLAINSIFNLNNDGFYHVHYGTQDHSAWTLNQLLNRTYTKIHSVKRLSDNSIYTIGDIVGCVLNDTIFDIKEIEISGEPYLINRDLHHYMPLRNAYKTKYPVTLSNELIEVKLTKSELYKLMQLINGQETI